MSEGLSGADLHYLIKQATVKAVQENRTFIVQSDLVEAKKMFDEMKVLNKGLQNDNDKMDIEEPVTEKESLLDEFMKFMMKRKQ